MGTADGTLWGRPCFGANTTGAKKGSGTGRTGSVPGLQPRTPRSARARRQAPRHARTPARADACVRTVAHTRSTHACFSPPRSGGPLSGASGRAEGTSASRPRATAPVCTCSSETVILLRSEFIWPLGLPLPKVKSSHETKLKALEQSMKTFATRGALCFLELK